MLAQYQPRKLATNPMKWVHRARVEGSGDFPVDMLRYDSCWPDTSDDVAFMGTMHYSSRGKRALVVACYSPYVSWPFTDKRWLSFGWSCEPA